MNRIGRLLALVVKEFLTLLRDPKGRVILIMPPLLQLVIFSFAATLEVKNVQLAVLNQDSGTQGMEFVQRLAGSPTFTDIRFIDSLAELGELVDRQHVMAAVHIPQNFSSRLTQGQSAVLQVILDGRRSNTAQIVNGYISQLAVDYTAELRRPQGVEQLPAVIVERNWFNENLIYLWFTVPSMVAILALLVTVIVSALSVARERELGTFEQLLVSPLMAHEILIGKTIPAVLIGFIEGMFILLMAVTVFGIPFAGSPLLFVLALLGFVMSIVGAGLFISALAKTQQQAILGTFVFMVPAITLSGYAAPVENMPHWLQSANQLNPLMHFLITVKGVFLKNMSVAAVWGNTWPLLIIGGITLVVAGWLFTRRLE